MMRVMGAGVDHPDLATTYIESYLQPRPDALIVTAERAIADRCPATGRRLYRISGAPVALWS